MSIVQSIKMTKMTHILRFSVLLIQIWLSHRIERRFHSILVLLSTHTRNTTTLRLLVQGLGVGGGGRNVGVTGSLVRAGGELELVGGLQVGIAGRAVGGGVILEVEQKGEHVSVVKHFPNSLNIYWGGVLFREKI